MKTSTVILLGLAYLLWTKQQAVGYLRGLPEGGLPVALPGLFPDGEPVSPTIPTLTPCGGTGTPAAPYSGQTRCAPCPPDMLCTLQCSPETWSGSAWVPGGAMLAQPV